MSGREATSKVQVGDLALSVGHPKKSAPCGWQWISLNALAEMATGHTPSRRHPEYWGGEIKWMCASDARFRHGGVVYHTEETINQLGIENSAAVVLPTDTVCLARTGASIGYAVRLGEPMATNQGFVNWICGENLSPRFLQYILVSEGSFLRRIAYGAAHHTIYFPELKAFHVCVPSLAEQQRIVSILDEAFAGIATAKANIEKNLQNARALFESQLQAIFTHQSNDWVKMRLSEVSKVFGRGKSKHRPRNDPKLYGGKYPFIQTGDVRNATHLITTHSQTYNEVGLAQSKLWPAGTLCITIAANIAETGILGFDACFPDSVIGVVVDETVTSNKFLEYLLQSFKAHLQAQGKGSAQDNINLGTFENQLFPFPSLEIQHSLVSTLDTLREETQCLESIYQRKLAALDELKKSLLHRAFTGNL